MAATACGVIAVVGLLVSLLAGWAHRTVFDEESFATAVDEAVADPEVTAALAAQLATLAVESVELEDRLGSVLPSVLDTLAPALTTGVRDQVEDQLVTVLGRDDVRATVRALVVRAHRAALRVLEGDGLVDGVALHDGAVVVNLLPLVGLGLAELQDLGLLRGVELPALTLDGDPDLQRADLEAAVGRSLPEDFGQLVVFEDEAVAQASATVASAQQTLVLVKRAMGVVLAVTVVALALALLLARHRRRALVALLLGSAGAFVVAHVAVTAVVARAPDVVTEPAASKAVAVATGSLAQSLFTSVEAAAAVCLLAAVGLWLVGPAAGLWSHVAGGRRSPGALLAGRRDLTAIGAGALAVAVLAVGGLRPVPFALALGLLAVAAWAQWAASPT